MKPILFEATETEFVTNGLGRLSDAISCQVTEERNGSYELEMTYPIDGIHFPDIKHSRIIYAVPADDKAPQPFRIYDISKPMNRKATIRAEHISYQMSDIPVVPFEADNVGLALSRLNTYAAEKSPFTFWTDKNTAAKFTVDTPQSMRSLLGGQEGSILDTYGGEWEFDRYTAKLWNHRGKDRDVTIRYGKNLTDLKQEESIAETCTGILPYWKGTVEGENSEENEETVMLDERTVYSENAAKFPFHKTKVVDFSAAFKEKPSQAQLRNAAQSYIKSNNIGVPKVTLTVQFIPLWQTEEYKNRISAEHINLCDAVHIEFEKLGISATAKVNKTVFDVLTERYESIELGDARNTLTDDFTASLDDVKSQLVKEYSTKTMLQKSIDRASKLIAGGLGGYVVLKANADGRPEEILILGDSPDYTTAQQVWRWNKNGLGYSSTGYNGEFRTAITADGHIAADFVDVGVLAAGIIKAGLLQDKAGINYWNMETGDFRLSPATVIGDSTVATQNDVSDAAGAARIAAEKKAKELADNAESLAKAAQQEADKKIVTFYQTSAPAGAEAGDLWINTSDGNSLHRWNGSSWVNIQDNKMQAALTAASDAQSTADGKISTFYQASAPSSASVGDLWFDSDDSNHLYRWTGSRWAETRDGYIDTAASNAQSAAQKYADTAASNAVNNQTQQSIFNKLTNNGKLPGIYMSGGQLYINAKYLVSGTIADKKGNNTWNLDTGELNTDKGTFKGSVDVPYSSRGYTGTTKIDSAGFRIEAKQSGSSTNSFYFKTNGNSIYTGYGDIDSTSDYATVSPYDISVESPETGGTGSCAILGAFSGGGRIETHKSNHNGTYKVTFCADYDGNLRAIGSKSRIVDTEDYGKRLLYCYETPTPLFGDVGEGTIGEDGRAYIQIDPTFAEAISTSQYQVALQKYGSENGKCYVAERHETYFVVAGTPNLKFGWEIKAKQRGYDQLRLDSFTDQDIQRNKNNYGMTAQVYIQELNKGRLSA